MKYTNIICLSAAVSLNACKTTTNSSDHLKVSNELLSQEIYCEVVHPTGGLTSLSVFPQSSDTKSDAGQRDLLIKWINKASKTAETSGQVSVSIPSNETSFAQTVNIDERKYDLLLEEKPKIKLGSIEGTCTTILTKVTTKTKSPSCNSIGTSAQGWYLDGKLVKYSKTCHQEAMSCGTSQLTGWFLQKKISAVEIAKEHCSWHKELPICTVHKNIVGWYLDEKLVSRDDDCRAKTIECSHSSDSEGWVVYYKSNPFLFAKSDCNKAAKSPPMLSKRVE